MMILDSGLLFLGHPVGRRLVSVRKFNGVTWWGDSSGLQQSVSGRCVICEQHFVHMRWRRCRHHLQKCAILDFILLVFRIYLHYTVACISATDFLIKVNYLCIFHAFEFGRCEKKKEEEIYLPRKNNNIKQEKHNINVSS